MLLQIQFCALGRGSISDNKEERPLQVINVQVSEALLQYNLDPLIKEGITLH